MDGLLWLMAIAGLVIAGVVKGATGLGYASCALPFLVPVVGLRVAMALVVVPAIVSNVQVVVTTGHVRATVRRFGALYAASMPGIVAGLALLLTVDARLPTKCLGIIIVTYAALALAKPDMTLSARHERRLLIPTGLVQGLLTGFTGAQVMPLFPFMMALRLEPARLVQAINVSVTLSSSVLAIGLVATGIVTPPIMAAGCLAAFPAMAGVALGSALRPRIPHEHFRRLVLVVLGLTGALLLAL